MKQKGSMTVAMSILLLVLLSLVTVSIQSSRTACARTQAVNSMDTGLYSLFSEYDRELLEKYNLFFLDASYHTGTMQISQVLSHLEDYMRPVLESGLTKCSVQICAADGLRIASDQNGAAVKQQIVRYMKENLGNAGIEALLKKTEDEKQVLEEQENIKDNGMEEINSEETAPMPEISETNNPLEIIKSFKENGFLSFVLPNGVNTSDKTIELSSVLSNRERQQGMGEFPELETEEGFTDKIFIQEYAFEKFKSFTDQADTPLSYEMEYLLGGKGSDRENLSSVVKKLLLLREISNLAFLYTNPQKQGEIAACASALSFLLLIPEGMTFVQGVLAAGWAYVESIADVKALLSGERVPLVKDADTWKTQLSNLRADTGTSVEKGIDYEEYLRILLMSVSEQKLTMRIMDLIEINLRREAGKESFAFDACIDAVAVSFQIAGPENKIWQAERMYSYDM
ncbi:MAG: DUF5702 domain-containing protein [Bacillota bacterium]|nr:DUF5702 domain-containing protein [Bacillota bacterium]